MAWAWTVVCLSVRRFVAAVSVFIFGRTAACLYYGDPGRSMLDALFQSYRDITDQIFGLRCSYCLAQEMRHDVLAVLLAVLCTARWLYLSCEDHESGSAKDTATDPVPLRRQELQIPTPSRARGRMRSPSRHILGPADSAEELQLLATMNTCSAEELGRIFQQASLDYVDEREAVRRLLHARQLRTIQTLDELATSAGMHRKSVNALLQQL
ncbi:unnamed protein product [Symbiodinium necroappetens]|uniref:Uncharacterized protein n=1 Tax=Symbiodinium necroappetens TaxID=1628268 RepID=A0A812P424_9DINO|nr:unnamed protein product [Symbiodinium necroappetens]